MIIQPKPAILTRRRDITAQFLAQACCAASGYKLLSWIGRCKMALSHKFLSDRYARQIWEDSQPEDGEFWYGQATALKLDIQARVGAENYRDWYWSQFPTDPPTSRALFKAIIQQYRTELLSQVANV